MDFVTYRLKDILDNYDTLRKPLSSMERADFQGNYPYYGAQGIIDYVADYRCDGEYLLIAEDGENLNTRNQPIASIAKGKFWVNNHAHIVKVNALADMKYTCYALNYMDISGYVTGTAQPKLSQKNLNRIKVQFPSLDKQRSISNTLSKYDDLIENNNRRIALLEKAAQELYKEWFVRFRFPGHETVDFEEKKPFGWVVSSDRSAIVPSCFDYCEFSELGSFTRGRNITVAEMTEGKIPVISAGLQPSGYHNKANVIGRSLTISASGANAGYLQYNLSDIWAADCSYYQNENNLWFIYCTLRFLQPVISNLQCGAAQPHVYPKNINKLCVLKPTKELIEKFNKTVEPFFDEIELLKKKNDNLIRQRDLLLPRLMSGKIDIDNKKQAEVLRPIKLSYDEFLSELGMAARAKKIFDADLKAMYEAYLNDETE